MIKYPTVASEVLVQSPALTTWVEFLRNKHGASISSVLVYGSCLRNGNLSDGLLDIYLICDSYRSLYAGRGQAIANAVLPPNVFYAEMPYEGELLRSKYSIISRHQFQQGCSRRWFESYIWGRFSQPVHIAWCRDRHAREHLEDCLFNAMRTFLARTLPVLPATGSVRDLWEDSLALSYGTELRTERGSRAQELADYSQEFFQHVTPKAVDSLPFPLTLTVEGGELQYRAETTQREQWQARRSWQLRPIQGKLMSVLRLVKALFTFESPMDYAAWKLERHSGEKIDIPDKVRRHPLIFMWPFFWGLYRRGIFK
jgi:hypothetical protein